MLSELLGNRKKPARQTGAIADQAHEVRQLQAALEEEASERWSVMTAVGTCKHRLLELPAALEACEHERFQAMTQHELNPDRCQDREAEFSSRRAGLVSEQQVLLRKRDTLEEQHRDLDRRISALTDTIRRTQQVMWESIVEHLSADLNGKFREAFLCLYTACHQVRDGIHPVVALDRAFDIRSFDDAARVACLERLKAEYDVP